MSKQQMIVVTGAAGFIGSNIVRKLLENKVSPRQIIAVDDRALFDSNACAREFSDLPMALLDSKDFLSQFESGSFKVDTVHHMGACSSTDEMRVDYLNEVNVEYSKRVWRECTRRKIPLVYASSGATYGAGEAGFSDEPSTIAKLQPLNPYGWSKQKFDLYVLEAVERGEAPPQWAGLKFFNVYGGGEEHKGKQVSVVYVAWKQIRETGKLKLFRSHRADVRDGEQMRDFVYVGDVVSACLSFAKGKAQSGIYNIGTGQARTFLDLGRAVFKAMGRDKKIEYVDTPQNLRAHYQYYTQADLSRLRAAGYDSEFTSLEKGIEHTIVSYERGVAQ